MNKIRKKWSKNIIRNKHKINIFFKNRRKKIFFLILSIKDAVFQILKLILIDLNEIIPEKSIFIENQSQKMDGEKLIFAWLIDFLLIFKLFSYV